MPRQPRLEIPGTPQHVMQAGVGESPVFACVDDRHAYLEQVYVASRADGCEVHAYALAPSHAQLLVSGYVPGAVARMMRRIGLAYARHANARDSRRGACWRGRYLSCPVGGTQHILLACGHVERSARHGVEASSEDRRWSSHAHNAHGADDRLVSPHAAYLELGDSQGLRMHRYRSILEQSVEIDGVLAMHTRQGRAWGSDDFLREVSALVGVQRPVRPPGRPRKVSQAVVALALFFLSPFPLTEWMWFVETL